MGRSLKSDAAGKMTGRGEMGGEALEYGGS